MTPDGQVDLPSPSPGVQVHELCLGALQAHVGANLGPPVHDGLVPGGAYQLDFVALPKAFEHIDLEDAAIRPGDALQELVQLVGILEGGVPFQDVGLHRARGLDDQFPRIGFQFTAAVAGDGIGDGHREDTGHQAQ